MSGISSVWYIYAANGNILILCLLFLYWYYYLLSESYLMFKHTISKWFPLIFLLIHYEIQRRCVCVCARLCVYDFVDYEANLRVSLNLSKDNMQDVCCVYIQNWEGKTTTTTKNQQHFIKGESFIYLLWIVNVCIALPIQIHSNRIASSLLLILSSIVLRSLLVHKFVHFDHNFNIALSSPSFFSI